ncbi:MAG: hypothetical protein IJR87_05225 [Bacteroidaceae bacterium]|nr:hypothetical protein [Bacteroidaceae bacterium]
MKESTRNRLFACLTGLAVLLTAIYLTLREGDVLCRAQELSLFLPTRQFYADMCIYPGGTLSWLGCLATQCFCQKAWTIVVLFLTWWACQGIAARIFRLGSGWSMLTLLIPIALAACMTQTGYWLYYQKLDGHMMVPALGVMLALLAAWLYRALPERRGVNYVWMAAWGCAGYPLLGAYSFLGTALMMCPCGWNRRNWVGRTTLPLLLGILLIWLIPQIACRHLYSQVNPSQIYRAAMPTFGIADADYPQYRLPYYALFASPLPAMLASQISERWRKRWQAGLTTSILLLGAALWGLGRVWYTDINFHKEVRMALAIERQDWESVLRIARESPATEPTRVIVMNKNLALFRLGRAGDEMCHYANEGALPNAPWMVRSSHVSGRQLFYQYGRLNGCYRWCMEDGVERGWSVETLQLMTKASLLAGDLEVARKYLNLLKKTWLHRQWAERYEVFLLHPERIAEDVEMGFIAHLMPAANRLDGDQSVVEQYLLDSFIGEQKDDTCHQELTLLCALQVKDIGLFWPRFFEYARRHPGEHIPTHYQEAAYLYGHLEQTVDISRMPFDDSVRKTYADFMAFNERCGNMSLEQKKAAFRPTFGHTFYYFYFLVRDIQTL